MLRPGETVALGALAAITTGLVAACRGPSVPAPTASAAQAPPLAPTGELAVAFARRPVPLVVDGVLEEWPASSGAPVRLAVDPDGFAVAARLDERLRDGFWLGVGANESGLLPVGDFVEIVGSVPDPVMGVVPPGCQPQSDQLPASSEPPTDACLTALSGIEVRLNAHQRRFLRWYRIEPGGVQMIGERGVLEAVAGARVSFRVSQAGGAAEATIPVRAMPRLAEAPLLGLWLGVRPASVPTPEMAELHDALTFQKLPEPLAFEPLAELRRLAFASSTILSFHPADPEHVEADRYPSFSDRRTTTKVVEPLYRKVAVVGAAEVSELTIGNDPGPSEGSDARVVLAVSSEGKVSVVPIEGTPVLTERRGEALHYLSFFKTSGWIHDGSPMSRFLHAEVARWSCIAIAPDGTTKELAVGGEVPNGWHEVEPVHDVAREAGWIGMRGSYAVWSNGSEAALNAIGAADRVELRWRWDATRGVYVLEMPRGAKR